LCQTILRISINTRKEKGGNKEKYREMINCNCF
jgi:hypothetical protein